jgi:hypothetical protein
MIVLQATMEYRLSITTAGSLSFRYYVYVARVEGTVLSYASSLPWLSVSLSISPNLKRAVYLGGIKYGGDAEWEHAWREYERTDVPSEKSQLLYALATTTDSVRLSK